MQRNVKLTIAYKGTRYAGWQRQPNAVTVEAVLTEALKSVLKENITLYGAGRTDAGVHAEGQCANFHLTNAIPVEKIPLAVNTKLPPDIRITRAEEVSLDFHSRYAARGKIYYYQLYLDQIASPFACEYSWQIRVPLDIGCMQQAAGYLIGEHDFRSFMASGSSVTDTVRRIDSIDFDLAGRQLRITYQGNGFLYNMVRILTGTLVEIGMHKNAPAQIQKIIAAENRQAAGITAPPQGLFLKEVLY